MIKFENVFIKYVQDFYSLYNFNCNICSNTLLIGDFYSGTSAIMRTISKIDNQYTGDIYIDNINIKNIKSKELDLSYLPHSPIIFKNKNIFKRLDYG